MKYTIKWIEKNLGISRKTINDYMNPKKYGYIEDKRNLDKLIEFTEDEVKRIWYIKTFIGMGYTHESVKEMIKNIQQNNECDFSSTISSKIEQLEEEIKLKVQALEFAKTIKLTGRVPIIKEIGAMKYEEFMKYIKENYNFASNPKIAAAYDIVETSLEKDFDDYNSQDINKLYSYLESFGIEELYFSITLDILYKLILKLKDNGFESDGVQAIVKILFEHFKENDKLFDINIEFDECFFATNFWPRLLEGLNGERYVKEYGKENIDFIYKAITYFGKKKKG